MLDTIRWEHLKIELEADSAGDKRKYYVPQAAVVKQQEFNVQQTIDELLFSRAMVRECSVAVTVTVTVHSTKEQPY